MGKRILPTLLAVCLLLALCACGVKKSVDAPSPAPAISATPMPEVTPQMTPAFTPVIPEGEYPAELPAMLQPLIDQDMTTIASWGDVKFKGSEITYLGRLFSFRAYESLAELWVVSYRMIPEDMGKVVLFNRSTDGKGGIFGHSYAVVQSNPLEVPEKYCGLLPSDRLPDFNDEDSCYKATMEVYLGIHDLEFSLSRDDFPLYYGLGSSGIDFWRPGEKPVVEQQPYTGQIFWNTGDYYTDSTWDGLHALTYTFAAEERKVILSIDTTLTDVSTYRGARVGMTKSEILTLYPEAELDEERNELWYPGIPSYARSFGYLCFALDTADTVTKITMNSVSD